MTDASDHLQRTVNEGLRAIESVVGTINKRPTITTSLARMAEIPSTETAVTDLAQTLTDRGNKYGSFVGHAEITQGLKRFVAGELTKRGKTLAPDQQEALDMIVHKMGRIINGDPDYADSWVDIAGYAKLVADRLEGTIR